MAVESTATSTGPLAANGATTAFNFTFKAASADEVGVAAYDADGVEADLSSFEVTALTDTGGTVTFDEAPADGLSVLVFSQPDFRQRIEFAQGERWLAGPVNEANDRAALRDLYLKSRIDLLSSAALLAPDARAGRFLAWDAGGAPILSSGTGSDPALRTDLAEVAGAALVGTAGGLTIQGWLDALFVPVTKFGVLGGGADDTAALQAAIDSGMPLSSSVPVIRVTAPITSLNRTTDLRWIGRTKIVYDSATHVEAVLKITTASAINIEIDDLTVDGGLKANLAWLIDSSAPMNAPPSIVMNRCHGNNVKRSAAFEAGVGGICFVGGCGKPVLRECGAYNIVLATGTGSDGIVGAAGISCGPEGGLWSTRLTLINCTAEKVHSEDLDYQSDQDGFTYFTPDDPTHPSGKAEGTLVVQQGSVINCYGRGVKTQCRVTIVDGLMPFRDEGLNSGTGNTEVDAQKGALFVRNLVASYANGFHPGVVLRAGSAAAYNGAALSADNIHIHLDDDTTLGALASTFPTNGMVKDVSLTDVHIHGKATMVLRLVCNGEDNQATLSNWSVDELVPVTYGTGGDAVDVFAAVHIAQNGVAPFDAFVEIEKGRYGDTSLDLEDQPCVAWFNIPGNAMTASVSARRNRGFMDDPEAPVFELGPVRKQAWIEGARTIEGKYERKAVKRELSLTVGAGDTAFFTVRKDLGTASILIKEGTSGNGDTFIEFESFNYDNRLRGKTDNVLLGADSAPAADPGVIGHRFWSRPSADGGNAVMCANDTGAEVTYVVFIREQS